VPPVQSIPEQQHALELFLQGGSLRTDAYAGTGKTTTLQLLAENSTRRGLYLAINRSIALEAKQRFPKRVLCATSHAIDFRGIQRSYRFSDAKLVGSLTPNLLLEAFRIPETVTFRTGLMLPRRSYASVLVDGIKHFLRSRDPSPGPEHIPRYGILEFMANAHFADFAKQAAEHLTAIWAHMRHKEGSLPLGHDGYLKLWALSDPVPKLDYIMVDEAQDLNPVLLWRIAECDMPSDLCRRSLPADLRLARRDQCDGPG
jgi:hypothetical protein